MYSLDNYGTMISDRVRLDAHAEALRRVVTPSTVVVDIGAGTGIMSLLACKFGARRVYAVEPSPAVQLLVEAARDNGYADRIVVLQRRSNEVTLPERADVIVSDLRGVLPPFQTHFADVVDARERLLANGGRLVPATDTIWIAPVSAQDAFEERRRPWQDRDGLVLHSALRVLDSSPFKHRARPEDLLGPAARWADIDYQRMTSFGLRGAGSCNVARAATAHGLLAWFDTVLVEGVEYSNAPGPVEGIYGQFLFPWPEPVTMQEGDSVAFEVRADPICGDVLWTWTSEIRRGRGPDAGNVRFRQSTFNSWLAPPDSLRKRAGSFAATLSPAGVRSLEVLEGIRAGKTIGEIAAHLLDTHPGRFPSIDDAHGFVAELIERFCV
jgi:protein arginine N-methyltransferase 1